MAYKDKDKQREFQRLWIAKRRKDFFDANGPCVKCSSWNRLELDHINPEDKVSHAIWSWSEKRRLEEIAKCQVLCHECHLQKTIAQFTKEKVCGTELCYKNGCRCDECRAANAENSRRHRRTKLDRENGIVS